MKLTNKQVRWNDTINIQKVEDIFDNQLMLHVWKKKYDIKLVWIYFRCKNCQKKKKNYKFTPRKGKSYLWKLSKRSVKKLRVCNYWKHSNSLVIIDNSMKNSEDL